MKKLYLTAIICAGMAVSALAQGTIFFDSSSLSSWVTLNGAVPTGPVPDNNSPTNLPAGGSWTAALLWAPGTTLGQPIGNFTVLGTVSGANANNGYISGNTLETATAGMGESAGASATFIVEGWQGNFANYAAAVAGEPAGGHVGMSVEFVNAMGNPNLTPPGLPAAITGWDGNLLLVPVPEPTTIALGGLGAAALLLFRRRKQ